MTYLLVLDNGTSVWGELLPSMAMVDELVGVHGWATVRLDHRWRTVGWVSDCGLVMPDRYERNPLGACLLAVMGGGQQPYAGPVLITGYDHGSDWGGPEPLDGEQMADLRHLHGEVVRALAGGHDGGMLPSWYEAIRSFAEVVRTGDVPPITVRSL